jgi:N-acetylneuraminic acid mutarotase
MFQRKWLTLIAILCISTISFAELLVFAENPSGSWVTKSPMKIARSDLGVATVNGKIYAIGGSTFQQTGLNQNGGITGANEEYNSLTDTWIEKTAMPTARMNFAVTVYQNKIYCIGGIIGVSNGLTFTGANEMYDPLTDTWETKAEMPVPKDSSLASVINGKVFVIGGYPYGTLNEVYDPKTDSWSMKTPMPVSGGWSSGAIDNNIYFIGGYLDSNNEAIPITEIYNAIDDTWRLGKAPPNFFTSASSAVTTGVMVEPQIYLIPIYSETFQIYNPKNDSWTTGPGLPTNRQNTAIAVVNDTLYVLGGTSVSYPDMQSTSYGGYVTKYETNEQYIPKGWGSYTNDSANSKTDLPNLQYIFPSIVITFVVVLLTVFLAYRKIRKSRISSL